MKQLQHIWFIAVKDTKLFFTDRLALFFFVLFPFMFIVLFNFLLGDIGGGDKRLELHLATLEAEGGLSYHIIESLETKDESQLKPGEPKIVWDKDYSETRKAVEAKKLSGFLAFPADFTSSMFAGQAAELEIVTDAQAIDTRAALSGLARAIASQVSSERVAMDAAVALLAEQGIVPSGNFTGMSEHVRELLAGKGGTDSQRPFIEFTTEIVGNVEAENPSNYVIPGYLVMFVFFAAALGAETIVRERQNHTLERLLATSVSRSSILGGVFVGTAFKGLIQIAIFWTVGVLAFRLDLGLSPVAVILLSILMVVMSAAFSIMLATLVKTQRAAGSIAVLTSLVLAPLGGCWWPLFITPKWMQFIAKVTPHGWATTGFNKLMVFGGDFASATPEMLALAGFAVVFGFIAVWRFRTSAV